MVHPKDDSNFFHFSSRICIECTFGKVDMRWGIIWTPFGFYYEKLHTSYWRMFTLHNFIVDYQVDNKEVTTSISLERMVFKDDHDRFLSLNPNIDNYGVQGDIEENQLRGCPTTNKLQSRQTRIDIRNDITSEVKETNHTRPKSNWYRDNNHFVDT